MHWCSLCVFVVVVVVAIAIDAAAGRPALCAAAVLLLAAARRRPRWAGAAAAAAAAAAAPAPSLLLVATGRLWGSRRRARSRLKQYLSISREKLSFCVTSSFQRQCVADQHQHHHHQAARSDHLYFPHYISKHSAGQEAPPSSAV